MSSFQKKQVLLAFGLMASALSVVASDYQFKRLNGTIMSSTGESKTVTIEIPVSKIPLYVFLDYNGQIPLSQRLELTSKASKAEITLLPASQLISVIAIPQADVDNYLNSAKGNQIEQEGVSIMFGQTVPPLVQQHNQALQRNTQHIAAIEYGKITQGQVITLPNPFEEIKAEEPKAEEPVTEEPRAEQQLAEEPKVEESSEQPEMAQPDVSGLDLYLKDFENKEVASNDTEDESKEDEVKENEE